ncbi:MAG TPA: hypothetical protein VKD45_09630, partial [Hyphomicrobiaceae bacterium]|nr:hypothetical protein [Hyphomicrobiaceae bacterium]
QCHRRGVPGFVNCSLNPWVDRDALNGDFKELHQEVKDAGYSVSLFRRVVREQRMEPEATPGGARNPRRLQRQVRLARRHPVGGCRRAEPAGGR